MYQFKIKGMTFGVSFSFLALVGFLTLFGEEVRNKLALCLACCIVHEIGHLSAMLCLGVPAKGLILYGGGMLIKREKGINSSNISDCIILLAGPLANAMLALLFWILGMYSAAGYNLFCAVFNLMPFSYFDGGRIADILFPYSKLTKLFRALIIIVFACIVFGVTLMGSFNISLLVTFLYIAVCEILA